MKHNKYIAKRGAYCLIINLDSMRYQIKRVRGVEDLSSDNYQRVPDEGRWVVSEYRYFKSASQARRKFDYLLKKYEVSGMATNFGI